MTRKKVLVADDNDHNRELARQCLADGFTVLLARDGSSALELARSGRPDLVLLDLSMPRMNGFDVARALKADPETARISLVACTAHAMAGDRERALAVGFDGYLAKPYRPRELVSFVEDFLGKGVPDQGSSDDWTVKS